MASKIFRFIYYLGNLLSISKIQIQFITIYKVLFVKFYSGYKANYFSNRNIENFRTFYPLFIIGGNRITVGKNFSSFRRNRIEVFGRILNINYNGKLVIGDNFSMNDDCHIACINNIIIGNNVLFASKIFVTDHFHGQMSKESFLKPPALRSLHSKGEVTIGDNVWVGEGVVILPGVSIGENCVIGANSVVTKSFPKNSIIGGNPAKLIRSI